MAISDPSMVVQSGDWLREKRRSREERTREL